MSDTFLYWSPVIRAYLKEFREVEADLDRATAVAVRYSHNDLCALVTAKREIGRRIALGITYLGGMEAAW
jgi:hypothetical protein